LIGMQTPDGKIHEEKAYVRAGQTVSIIRRYTQP
jgi:hypothetical protein